MIILINNNLVVDAWLLYQGVKHIQNAVNIPNLKETGNSSISSAFSGFIFTASAYLGNLQNLLFNISIFVEGFFRW